MGRRRTRPEPTRDRFGEPVDLEKCPECREHKDCFSCMEGRCTALKESGGGGCVFYCPEEKAVRESREAYLRLKESGRYDLIQKYIKPMTALGVLDGEIEDAARTVQELEAFKEKDLEALMQETPGYSE